MLPDVGANVVTSIGSNELDTLKSTSSNKVNSTSVFERNLLFAWTFPAISKFGAYLPPPKLLAGTSRVKESFTVEGQANLGLYPNDWAISKIFFFYSAWLSNVSLNWLST